MAIWVWDDVVGRLVQLPVIREDGSFEIFPSHDYTTCPKQVGTCVVCTSY